MEWYLKFDKGLRFLARLLFAGLILFELLNEVELLNFTLDFTWLGLAITSLSVLVILELAFFYLRKKNVAVHGRILFLAAIVVYLDAFGDIFKFYSRFGWYDKTLHFFASAVVILVAFEFITCLKRAGGFSLGLTGCGILAALIASFAGVLYEIEEYLEDYFRSTNRLGDGPDTVNDLMMNLLGAMMILGIIALIDKYNERQRNRKTD